MTTTIEDNGVRLYTARVAEQLDDLPDAERQELLEDLEQHLLEVAAEADGDLVERLGPPEAYAAELRASAGIAPRGEPMERSARERLIAWTTRSGPGRAIRSLAATEAVRGVRDFLPELRPGWWVLRGYLGVFAIALLWSDRSVYPWRRALVPSVFGPAIGLVLVGLAMWASVRLGRRASGSKVARRLSLAVSMIVVLMAVAALNQVQNRVVPIEALRAEPYSSEPPAYLQHPDGEPITNICPYAADGSPLSGVLLFDQTGRPIEEVAPPEAFYGDVYSAEGDSAAPQPSLAVVPNAYPRPQRIADPNTGAPIDFRCPPVVAGTGSLGGTGIPTEPTASPSSVAGPSSSPSPSP
jgi:hypothetical protein